MVWITGTAADFDDLFSQFVSHITTNATLTNDGQNWSQAWNVGDEYVFTGPGLAGTDTICVGIKKVKDTAAGRFEWELRGMSHVNAQATTLTGHGNPMPEKVRILLHDASMDYWLAVNGRRFVLVVKVSSYYEAAYGGFFLPFLPPAEYPYPLYVGGASGDFDGGYYTTQAPEKWSDDVEGHILFPFSRWRTDYGAYYKSSAHVVHVDGSWIRVDSSADNDDFAGSIFTWPWAHGQNNGSTSYTYQGDGTDYPRAPWIRAKCRGPLGGSAITGWPCMLAKADATAVLGQLDGVFLVTSDGISAEGTANIDGKNCIVFPNVWRSGPFDLWALEQA